MTITQPLKWHGGKGAFHGKLAKWIISLMPARDSWHLYSEPYFGGGSVAMHLDPHGVSELHNDINGELMTFWSVIGDAKAFVEFRRLVESTPFAEPGYDTAMLARETGWGSPVHKAYWFFVACRQSREGKRKRFATTTARIRRGMNENVSAWWTAVDGLPEVHARVSRMEFRNMDGAQFINDCDHSRRLFYCDPTYLHETRTTTDDYEHEMSLEQHKELLKCLAKIKGRFLLSGYRSELYDQFAANNAWCRQDFQIPNNASSKKQKDVKTECVWMNYRAT